MPKPRSRAAQAPLATPEHPSRIASRRPPEMSPFMQHARELSPLRPPPNPVSAAYGAINPAQSPPRAFGLARFGRDADDVVAGHSNRAFISPARGGSRPHASLMSPGTLPKSPPLFLASPDRRRGAGAGHVDRMTPGGMIDGPSLLANLASPAAIIRRPGSDLPEPGRQVGGVPPGFGTPKQEGEGAYREQPAGSDGGFAARRLQRLRSGFSAFPEPLCGAAVTRQPSAPLLRGSSGALRGEARSDGQLSRLVETAHMHSVHPAPPLTSSDLLQPPPPLQLDILPPTSAPPAEVAAPTPAAMAAATQPPPPRSATKSVRPQRAAKAAAKAAKAEEPAHETPRGDAGAADSWTTLAEAAASATPSGRRLSTATSGARGSLLSVVPPDTPDDAPAPNSRRQSTATSTAPKHCHCKKSKCLKLYCDCFAAGMYCNSCNCTGCANTVENAETVAATRRSIEERNPDAFKAKIVPVGDGEAAPAAHRRGCHCKKSGCKKKYCECFQAGAPCGKACKCENCQNQPPPGGQPPLEATLTEDPAAVRRPSSTRGGGGRSRSAASPATPAAQPRTAPITAATPSATASMTVSASTASAAGAGPSPPPAQPAQRPHRQPQLPAARVRRGPPRSAAAGADRTDGADMPPGVPSLAPRNAQVSHLVPAPTAPQELDAALAAAAPMAGIEQLRHADSAPPGCLPSAPSPAALPAGLPAGSRMVETAEGPMMLVPIIPPNSPHGDASRTGGFAFAGGGGALRGAGDSQQQAVLPMVWSQAPGGGMVPVPMQIPDDRECLGNGGQLALLVGRPAAEGEHSSDGATPATPAAPTPATMFAGLTMDADGNLTVTPELGQGQLLAAAAAADEHGGASMLQTPAGRLDDALQYMGPGEEGEEDLQALLAGAGDYGEAGDGTSRHSLDLTVDYEYVEVGDLSQSPASAQENGEAAPRVVDAAAGDGGGSGAAPEKPLSDITATADSSRRAGRIRRPPCSPTQSARSPASPGRTMYGKRKREDMVRPPLLGRFAAVAHAVEASTLPPADQRA